MHTNEDELMNAFVGVVAVWPKHSVTQCIEKFFRALTCHGSGLLSPLRRATTVIFSGIAARHGESRSGKTARNR
jgi:hypothetical protein